MLINAIYSLNELESNPPPRQNNPNFLKQIKEWDASMDYYKAITRIALHSFISRCDIISKTIWPCPDRGTTEEQQLRQKRKDCISHLFPKDRFPNLNDNFRNFLEHFDDRLDSWMELNKNNGLANYTIDENPNFGANTTIWHNIHPISLRVNYHDKKGSRTVNLKRMCVEITKLIELMPDAMDQVEGSSTGIHKTLVSSLMENDFSTRKL